MNIKKNDNVIVLTGRDRNKTGIVTLVKPKEGLVVVKGINMIKKHQKKNQQTPQAGIIEKFAPLATSKIAIICPSCSRPTRVKFLTKELGEKIRVCAKCKASLDEIRKEMAK